MATAKKNTTSTSKAGSKIVASKGKFSFSSLQKKLIAIAAVVVLGAGGFWLYNDLQDGQLFAAGWKGLGYYGIGYDKGYTSRMAEVHVSACKTSAGAGQYTVTTRATVRKHPDTLPKQMKLGLKLTTYKTNPKQTSTTPESVLVTSAFGVSKVVKSYHKIALTDKFTLRMTILNSLSGYEKNPRRGYWDVPSTVSALPNC